LGDGSVELINAHEFPAFEFPTSTRREHHVLALGARGECSERSNRSFSEPMCMTFPGSVRFFLQYRDLSRVLRLQWLCALPPNTMERSANPSRGRVQTASRLGPSFESSDAPTRQHSSPHSPQMRCVECAYVGQQRAHLFIKRLRHDLKREPPAASRPLIRFVFEPQFEHF